MEKEEIHQHIASGQLIEGVVKGKGEMHQSICSFA